MKKLRILRGLPGSGKTTLAKKLSEEGAAVFSVDDVLAKGGNIRWTEEGSLEAHQENQWRLVRAMREGYPNLVVDNINIQPFVVSPYVRMAKYYKYEWAIEDVSTPWALDVNELFKRNTHGISRSIIEAMYKAYIAMPTPAMVASLQYEEGIDPEQTLLDAQRMLEIANNLTADEKIMDYQDWRRMGGYEPAGGDETANNISRKLNTWRGDMYAMGW